MTNHMMKTTKADVPEIIKFPSFYEDQLLLCGRHWPADKPKAALFFIHTFCDYGNRTTFLQEFFNQHQFAVFDYDWRGHGQSDGERGYIPNVQACFGDIEAAMAQIKQRYPSCPLVIWGYGVGASIIIFYTMTHKDQLPFQGLIVSSPATNLPRAKFSRLGLTVVRVFSYLSPTLRLPFRAEQYAKKMTDNKAVLKAYQKDPYIHDRWPARTVDLMLEASVRIQKGFAFPVPILTHYGTKSIIRPKIIQEWVDRSRLTKVKEFKVWEGLHHELHNDMKRNEVFEHSLDWIEKNVISQTDQK